MCEDGLGSWLLRMNETSHQFILMGGSLTASAQTARGLQG
jgi:hypothetical protein